MSNFIIQKPSDLSAVRFLLSTVYNLSVLGVFWSVFHRIRTKHRDLPCKSKISNIFFHLIIHKNVLLIRCKFNFFSHKLTIFKNNSQKLVRRSLNLQNIFRNNNITPQHFCTLFESLLSRASLVLTNQNTFLFLSSSWLSISVNHVFQIINRMILNKTCRIPSPFFHKSKKKK